MRESRVGWFFLFPGLVVLAAVTIVPVASVVNISLHEWVLTETPEGPAGFVGFENYRNALVDDQVWNSLWVTLVYTAITVFFSLLIGVIIAVVIKRGGRGTGTMKAMLIFPFAISLVLRGYSFRFMLLDFGVIDTIIDFLPAFVGLEETIWLGEKWWARFWVSVPVFWAWGPLSGLMLVGALNNIAPDIFEAAKVDGAGPWRTLRSITLPLLRPMMFVITLLVTLFSVRMFDLIQTMTFGGPGRDTETINYFIYRQGFQIFNMGYASALAMFLTVVLVILSYLYAKMMIPND